MNDFLPSICLFLCAFILSACSDENSENDCVTDIDGNVYQVVELGSQVWMAENLRCSKYSNGNSIPFVLSVEDWKALESEAYCMFNNDEDMGEEYGYLYNWFAVSEERNICPTGWHVPDYEEWSELILFLGGLPEAGGAMKDTGTLHWENNTDATNLSGLTMLPGGYRSYFNGAYNSMGIYGAWWANSEIDRKLAWGIALRYYNAYAYKYHYEKNTALSIRCIKD
jgi:uncharacterized protein (TIGR02145 family)